MPLLSSGEIFLILLLMVKNSRKLDLKCVQDFFFKQVILYEIYRELSKCGKFFDRYFVKSLGSYISDSLLYEVKTIPR
jgi:hypothetical protein